MAKKKRLGEMLIDAGHISEAQLKEALGEARKKEMKLGQYLVQFGIVNESQIVNTISVQQKIEKYQASKYPVNMDLATIIPADTVQKYQLAPLEKKGSLLKVAMVDPMDLAALDTVEVLTNCEVEPIICTEQELTTLIGAVYGKYTSLDGVLSDIDDAQEDSMRDTIGLSGAKEVDLSAIQDMAEEAPVVRLVNSILTQAVREGASDLHLSPDKGRIQLRFRVDGKLHEVPPPPIKMLMPIISRFKILSNMDISSSRIPQDGRFTVKMANKEINIRASTMPTIYGENLVLRLLDMSAGVGSLDNLGVHPDDIRKLESIIYKPYGMILSTGPTGSGKSTTLYSILKKLNEPDANIITLEDPVEFRIEGIRQAQLNRKAGMTFASGLKSILRQDPDVIMVGEIRDTETATIAVQAAMTGHRVLSTVHTNDAAGAIARFIDMGIERFLVSSVMLVSIAQRLIRRICTQCQEPYEPSSAALEFFDLKGEGAHFVHGKGCINCMETGFKGRTGIYEVLIINEAVQDMIMKKLSSREITKEAKKMGYLKTLKDDAADKIRQGITTPEEAASAVMN